VNGCGRWSGGRTPRRRDDIARRAVLATLVLGGPRVKELCWFDGHHVDLPGRRLRVPRVGTKSVAGVRMVPMLPGLHELLLEHRAARAYRPEEPVFATRNGTRNTPNNVLNRIVVSVRAEANRLLAEREQEPIERLTPHTLRRTFASILALCEVHPRRARQTWGTRTRAPRPTSMSRISTTPTLLSDCSSACSAAISRRRTTCSQSAEFRGETGARRKRPAEAGLEALLEE
jgi:integrase